MPTYPITHTKGWPVRCTEEYLQGWSESAARAGDSETHLIAEVALGHEVDETLDWECGSRRAREIARMSPLGAARLAARW